jgi:CII-binding regulator of phage lambda lysogenization HflD
MEVTNKDNYEIDDEQNVDNIDVRPAKIYRRANLIIDPIFKLNELERKCANITKEKNDLRKNVMLLKRSLKRRDDTIATLKNEINSIKSKIDRQEVRHHFKFDYISY